MNRKEKQSNLMSQFNLINSPAHITYWDMSKEEHIRNLEDWINDMENRISELRGLIKTVEAFEAAGGIIGRKVGNTRIMSVKQIERLIDTETKHLNYLTRKLEKERKGIKI